MYGNGEERERKKRLLGLMASRKEPWITSRHPLVRIICPNRTTLLRIRLASDRPPGKRTVLVEMVEDACDTLRQVFGSRKSQSENLSGLSRRSIRAALVVANTGRWIRPFRHNLYCSKLCSAMQETPFYTLSYASRATPLDRLPGAFFPVGRM